MAETLSSRSVPDRNRLSVVTAVILLAYALARFVQLPSRELKATLFGSSIGIELNGNVIILLMVAALISTGSDTLIRSHPKLEGGFGRTALHWILPGATALALGLLLNLAPLGPVWWLGLAISALFLVIVLVAEYAVVDPDDPSFTAAAFGLTALGYIVALALFGWMRYTGARAALSATAAAILAALIAVRLFMLGGAPFRPSVLYAGVVGLVIGQAMWAVNYWRTTPVAGGLMLLVLFYVLYGIAWQRLSGQITRRVIIEFAIVGLVGAIIGMGLAAAR